MFEDIDFNYNEKSLELIFLVGTDHSKNCLVYDPLEINNYQWYKIKYSRFLSSSKTSAKVITEKGVIEFLSELKNHFDIKIGRRDSDIAAEFSATEEQIRDIYLEITKNPENFYSSENKKYFR